MLVTDPADLPVVQTALDGTVLVGLDVETAAPDAKRLSEKERKAAALDPRVGSVRLLSLDTDTTDTGWYAYLVDCQRVDTRPLFDALAERPVVAHNALFDLRFLARLGFVPGAAHCTMLQAQLLAAGTRDKVSLAACAQRELGRELSKEEQSGDWSGGLTAAQLDYAAEDARVLAPLHAAQMTRLRAAGLERVYEIERRCLPAVVWMADKGVAFDRQTWLALAGEAEAEANALSDRLNQLAPQNAQAGLSVVNWNSPVQIKAVFHTLGISLDSTDDEHLAAVNHPIAEAIRDYRAARKRCTTYGADWLKHVAPDNRVYAGWRQLGADSGRMSCRDPNLQNLPRNPRYRKCFVAPPGRVLVKADYSQVELRIAAKIAGEQRMVEAYRRGDDLHTLTARMLLGKDEVTKADRQLAKAVNFGLLYGMGWKGFRIYARTNYGVDLTAEQAQSYRAAFFQAYPGLARWHQQVRRAHAPETRTLTGRRRLLTRDNPDHLAAEHPGAGRRGGRAEAGPGAAVGAAGRGAGSFPRAGGA
jgi:DNA polymerase-1